MPINTKQLIEPIIMTEFKSTFELAEELSRDSMDQFMRPPRAPHCSMCPSVDVKYNIGPAGNPVCAKCIDFMNKELGYAD